MRRIALLLAAAAGSLDDGILLERTWARFVPVLELTRILAAEIAMSSRKAGGATT